MCALRVGSVVGIDWGGIGMGCGSCGLELGDSRVLLRFRSLSVISVLAVCSGHGVFTSSLVSSDALCVIPHCVAPDSHPRSPGFESR